MATRRIYEGDSTTLECEVLKKDGTPMDITGATIRWQMSATSRPGPAALQKSTASGITIADAPAGRFDVALAPGETEGMVGLRYHEAEVSVGGQVSTVALPLLEIVATMIKA